jgi:uncharacterized protein (TIGR02996 family)
MTMAAKQTAARTKQKPTASSQALQGPIAPILARPEDDAPRRAYAKSLAKDKDPRGDFIALQCDLAEVEADDLPLDSPEAALRSTNRRRAAQLYVEHQQTWFARPRKLDALITHRGGPAHVWLDDKKGNAAWLRELLSMWPVESVSLWRYTDQPETDFLPLDAIG